MGVYSATKFHFFPAARKLSPSNLGPKNRFFTRKSWPKGLFLKNLGNFKKILGIFRKFLQFWGNFEEFWGIFADFGLILINFKLFPQNPENFSPSPPTSILQNIHPCQVATLQMQNTKIIIGKFFVLQKMTIQAAVSISCQVTYIYSSFNT